MNKEIKELIEMCEELECEILEFKYLDMNECYIALIKPIVASKEEYLVKYKNNKWIIDYFKPKLFDAIKKEI